MQIGTKVEHLYFHVPWCRSKCAYCNFFSRTSFDFEQYFEEAKRRLQYFAHLRPRTVYFGGGTPSLLSCWELERLLGLLDLSRCRELSIECNPQNIDPAFACCLKALGFNRVSLGVQTLLDKELEVLGRSGSVVQSKAGYSYLRQAGFSNISLDLIYGLPGQSLEDVLFSVQRMVDWGPEHISTYLLSLEPEVRLYEKKDLLPSDDRLHEFYYKSKDLFESAGFEHYELSNFARPGRASAHNLAYWQHKFYLGVGPGACSFYQKGKDCWRENGQGRAERLSLDQLEREYIFLSLRLAQGLDLSEYRRRFGADFRQKYARICEKYRDFLRFSQRKVALRSKALFVSDEIFCEF